LYTVTLSLCLLLKLNDDYDDYPAKYEDISAFTGSMTIFTTREAAWYVIFRWRMYVCMYVRLSVCLSVKRLLSKALT